MSEPRKRAAHRPLMGKRPRVALHTCIAAETKQALRRLAKQRQLPTVGHVVDQLASPYAKQN